jgi:hypothetical protein
MYIAVIIVLLIVVAGGVFIHHGYKKCKYGINKLLPAKLKNKACSGSVSGFVGAFGRAPGMEHCHAWGGDQTRVSTFNRCTWV